MWSSLKECCCRDGKGSRTSRLINSFHKNKLFSFISFHLFQTQHIFFFDLNKAGFNLPYMSLMSYMSYMSYMSLFLREKSEKERQGRAEEMELRKAQLELEQKKTQ